MYGTTLTPKRYIEATRQDGESLAAAAERDLGASVPSCPGWTQKDLVGHVGGIYGWVEGIVGGRVTRSAGRYGVLEAPTEKLVDVFRLQLDKLVEVFGKVDPDEPIWNWTGPQIALSWMRRMACETAVHRWDAQLGVGPVDPIDADVARDAIGELLEVFAPAAFAAMRARMQTRPGRPRPGLDGRVVCVVPSEADLGWIVRLGPDDVGVSSGDRPADLELRGCASDLLLVLRSRRPPSTLSLSGDTSLLGVLRRLYP